MDRHKIINNIFRRQFLALLSLLAILCQLAAPSVLALSPAQRDVVNKSIGYFNVDDDVRGCSTVSFDSGTGNLDYAGRPILTQGQIEQITLNKDTYVQAAGQVGIPWQMIAVIHLLEHNLGRDNPDNRSDPEKARGDAPYSNGAYQNTSNRLPVGPIDDAEFLRQTIQAAEFIKGKAGNELNAASPPEAIKDTFWGYNGRAEAYTQQAISLGFPADQGYEGSPYVMNKADAQRDPEINTTTWGQIRQNNGPLEYPANGHYGAFVIYGSLAGIAAGCSATGNNARIVEIAKQEYAAGASEANGGYLKYTGGIADRWCAYFVSWVVAEAGKPFEGGVMGAVESLKDYAINKGYFHPQGEAGFAPQPGDIAIYKEGVGPYPSHTNIVISYNAASQTYTSIGGNEGDGIKQQDFSINLSSLTGFIRIP